MSNCRVRVLASVLLFSLAALAQIAPKPPSPPRTVYLRCGALWDGKADQLQRNVVIAVEGERIKSVGTFSPPAGSDVVDLGNQTCLPGLIDTHTHVLLQGDITADDYDQQLLKYSTPYRTILGTQSARKALEYGFTTLRDLETEGAMYADVDIRNAINRGVIPGPRMKVATRAIDVTGSYPLLGYSWEIKVPKGVQEITGADQGREAVRQQLSNGADWIKVYVDRSYYVQDGGVLNDIPTLTPDELRAIVDETHRERHKIAAHAMALQGVHNAVEAGVDSIEHGDYIAPDDMKTMIAKGIYYVPTLFVGEYVAQGRAAAGAPVWVEMVKINAETFRRALQAGVKIAFGTDAGGFDWNINPAVQFPTMVKYGMTPAQALRSATTSAADLLGMQNDVGTLETGKFADVIAVPGNPLSDVGVLQKVGFVMKGGVVYKK